MHSQLTIFTTLALHHLVIGAALLVVLLVLIRLFKPSAEMQSWLWCTAFVISTLVPFSLFVTDSKPLPVAIQQMEKALASDTPSGSRLAAVVTPTQLKSSSKPQWHVPVQLVDQLSTWLNLFLLFWFLGSCWRALSVGRAALRTQRLLASARPVDSTLSFGQLCTQQVMTSDHANTPMATGLVEPVILLPSSLLDQMSEEQLAPVILHEQAHIERKDLWVGLFQETIAIVFWWSPVIRVLNRKIHINRELACDIRAARKLANGKQYAQSLLDCTRLMLTQHSNVLAMGLFSKKKDLTYRVNEVLKIENLKTPKVVTTAVACIVLATATISAAQTYAPQVNLSDIQQDSNHFSKLSREQGEMLMEIIQDNNHAMLELMISNGLDVNTPIIGDGTALIVAVKAGNREMVDSLIQLGADVNQSARGDGNPLITAARANNLELAEVLYKQGAKVDALVKGDESALISASWSGHLAMVQFLVERGADVNLGVEVTSLGKGSEYRSPLNKAGSPEIRDYLISQGADA